MTTVQWLIKELTYQIECGVPVSLTDLAHHGEQAMKLEKRMLLDAMNYALDEDGHTGDWKSKFINDYYQKIKS